MINSNWTKTIASTTDLDVKGKLDHSNHITTYNKLSFNLGILWIYQNKLDVGTLPMGDYELVKGKFSDDLNPLITNVYDNLGNALDVVIYKPLIPEGSKRIESDNPKDWLWEYLCDANARKQVFDNTWIIEYNTGFIAGTQHPTGQSKGMVSAAQVNGYNLWQNYIGFRKKNP